MLAKSSKLTPHVAGFLFDCRFITGWIPKWFPMLLKTSVGMVSLCVLASSPQAMAQTVEVASTPNKPETIAVVIVNGTKRGEQNLQSVGASIAVLTAAELEKRRVTEFIDIARNIPGVSVVEGGPGQKSIMIRGITGAGESTVGLYYDNMLTSGSGESAALSNGRQTDLYVYDAERVEVFRGPQSTLYGSSALAGVVRIITKAAELNRFGANLVLGTAHTKDGANSAGFKSMLNVPILQDRLGLRLVTYKINDGGYIDNPKLGLSDINHEEKKGVRLHAKLLSSERGTLQAQWMSQTMQADDQATERPYPARIVDQVYPALSALQNEVSSRQPRYDHTKMLGLTYEHQFEQLNLIFTHSVFDRHNQDQQDLQGLPIFLKFLQSIKAFPPVPVIPQGIFQSIQDTAMHSSELRAATHYPGAINGVLGVSHSQRKIELDNRFYQTDVALGLPIYSLPSWYQRVADFSLKQLAVYGDINYDVNAQLALQFGARSFRNERLDHGHTITGFMRLGGLGPVNTQTSAEAKTIYQGRLNYQVDDSLLLYGSASQGYRAGGTINQIVPELPAQYGPDYTWNFETGLKSTWLARRLQVNLALYRINWYDMQVNGSFFNGAFDGILNCSGRCAHSQGLEVEMVARPVTGLKLSLAATVFKAQLDQDQPSLSGAPKAGTQLQKTPTFSASGAINYRRDFGSNYAADVQLDFQHIGRVAVMSYDASLNLPAPAYTLVNGYFTVSTGQHWELKFYGRNLSNVRARVNTEYTAVSPALVYVNRPRTFGLELALHY